MKTQMIINRAADWFDITDVELDECYFSMILLSKLKNRVVLGLDYDRFKLSNILYTTPSSEILKIVDHAIVILVSRELIKIAPFSNGKRKILITDLGLKACEKYEEVLKNEN